MSIQCNGILLHTAGDVLKVSTETGEAADIEVDEIFGATNFQTGSASSAFQSITISYPSVGKTYVAFSTPLPDDDYHISITGVQIFSRLLIDPSSLPTANGFSMIQKYINTPFGLIDYYDYYFCVIRHGQIICHGKSLSAANR
tara:strand:- start:1021 stop:1449 length:429 start_codon:yes stop_codon:yes gene_type:complete